MSLYLSPDGVERLGDVLRRELQQNWTRFRFAVAYAKMSGIDHLHDLLTTFACRANTSVTATIGIDQHGSSYEALAALLTILKPRGHQVFVCFNPRSKGAVPSPTFHPKLWLLEDGARAVLLAGSGNLTQGGLYSNYEVGSLQSLNLTKPLGKATYDRASAIFDQWSDTTRGDVKALDMALLNALSAADLVLSEDEIRRASRTAARTRIVTGGRTGAGQVGGGLFGGEDFQVPPVPASRAVRQTPAAAAVPVPQAGQPAPPAPGPQAATRLVPQHRAFYIHLSTAAKTEIYLAKAPMVADPAFFGLPFTGLTSPRGQNNPAQPQANPWPSMDVTIIDAGGTAHAVRSLPTKVWQYVNGPNANDDVRIYFGAQLQRNIVAGSVMEMVRDPRPGVEYEVRVVPPSHPDFAQLNARCTQQLPNSTRRYGWV